MSEEEKDFALRKNIIIGIIIIVVTYGIYSTPVLAIFNNVEIIISNEFLNALVSISTSFFSIFAIIMFFVYPEIKKNLETVENKTIEMPKKYDDTGLVNDPIMYQRFLDEKSNRVKKLRKQRNQIISDFELAFILNIFSLSFIVGKYLVPTEVYISSFNKGYFIFLSTIPMFVGIGLMLWVFLQVIIFKSDI